MINFDGGGRAFGGSGQSVERTSYEYSQQPTSGPMATAELLPKERLWGAAFFYLVLGVACFTALALTLQAQPLFPFQLDSLPWSNAWLIMTVGDYYGSALCLCGFIVATEPAAQAAAWSLGCLLLGSPVCCLYMLYRLHYHRTLRLFDRHSHAVVD